MTTARNAKGQFVARRTRRNPDGAGYVAGGKFHPVRSWAGYNPERAGEGKKTKPERRPKVGTPEERSRKARALVELRALQTQINALSRLRSALPPLTAASERQRAYGEDVRKKLIDTMLRESRKIHDNTMASVRQGYPVNRGTLAGHTAQIRRRIRFVRANKTAQWWINHHRFGTI